MEESLGRLVRFVRVEVLVKAVVVFRLRFEGRLEGVGFSRVEFVFDLLV